MSILAGLLLVCSILQHLGLYEQIRGFADERVPKISKFVSSDTTIKFNILYNKECGCGKRIPL